ncbi:dipeptidase [Fusibacter sp. 3D3]|uniref:dipeptidase n=1 Tax=Fusibacter sp. 3D3 TaxID=1048380 RepID=UPI000852C5BD|nr:dipeptidase [Fusibacter sp. 3D3]GAU76025.1 microsomal dipeptidase [Fusibacter sp. 3D3]
MKFIDMHCDTLMQLLIHDRDKADLLNSKFTAVDFQRMKSAGQLAQFFAVFLPPPDFYDKLKIEGLTDAQYINRLHGYLMKNVEANGNLIKMAYNAQDIIENEKQGKMSALLTMEDSRDVNGKLSRIKEFYDMGFRAMSLTWNFENCFGYPNSTNPEIMNKGLKDFGKEAVEYMQNLGMIVDVSHLSDGGFYDVAKICKKPFVATHSNARSLSNHQRNLTDDMIKVLANQGGITGINFAPAFSNVDTSDRHGYAKAYAEMAKYIANVGGVEVIGLGSDLDGISGELEIDSCDKMYLLEEALKEVGFKEAEIEKMFYKNVLRVMKACL